VRKIKLYIATSLNGKIAQTDGSIDWLESIPNPDQLDYGYSKFYDSVDTTIQGNTTYKQIISWGIDFPYADKKNFVFTKDQNLKNTKYVNFVSTNHIEFTKELKNQKGKDIWLLGGGKINTLFLNNGLIDEIYVFVMPVILSDGIEIFESLPNETSLKLINTVSYPTGAIELHYKID
jgi:dihydrofolate reductase